MKTTFVCTLLIALAAVWSVRITRPPDTPPDPSQRFIPLGDLPGGVFDSAPYGISTDGSIVIGCSNSVEGVQAFRWTQQGGMVGLGFSQALATSADGSTVVGFRLIAGGTEPVRWTQHDGLQGLSNISGCVCGDAAGVSADGSVIVGSCSSDVPAQS